MIRFIMKFLDGSKKHKRTGMLLQRDIRSITYRRLQKSIVGNEVWIFLPKEFKMQNVCVKLPYLINGQFVNPRHIEQMIWYL